MPTSGISQNISISEELGLEILNHQSSKYWLKEKFLVFILLKNTNSPEKYQFNWKVGPQNAQEMKEGYRHEGKETNQ